MSAHAAGKKPLKIGIICEGQRGCADRQVFPHLIKLICPDAKYDIVPSGNRPKVLANAPVEAKRLLDAGCNVVFVFWDVFPEFPDRGGTTDCKQHRKTLDENLKAAKMTDKPIIPVAIRQMFEAWLLCDADALMAVIGPLINKKPIAHEKSPDTVSDPKTALKELFKLGRGNRYNDSYSAGQIAAKLTSTMRPRRSQSFKRFEDKLKELCRDDS